MKSCLGHTDLISRNGIAYDVFLVYEDVQRDKVLSKFFVF